MKEQQTISLAITYAVISILLALFQVIFGANMWLGFTFAMLMFIAPIALAPIFAIKERRMLGGYIRFGQVFRLGFLGLLGGGFIYSVFMWIYVDFIDTEYTEVLLRRTLESQKYFMEGRVPEEQMRETMALTEENIRQGHTFEGLMKGLLYYSLYFLVLSLIFAAFLKKNPPEFQGEASES